MLLDEEKRTNGAGDGNAFILKNGYITSYL